MYVWRNQGFRFLNPKVMTAKLQWKQNSVQSGSCMDTELWCEECTSCQELQLHFRDPSEHSHKASNHWLFCYHLPITTSTRSRAFQIPGFDKTAYSSVILHAQLPYKTHICHHLSMGLLQHLFLPYVPPLPQASLCLPALCLCPLPLSSQSCARCLPRRDGYGRGGSGKGRDPHRRLHCPRTAGPRRDGRSRPGSAPSTPQRNPARVEAGAGRAKSGGR